MQQLLKCLSSPKETPSPGVYRIQPATSTLKAQALSLKKGNLLTSPAKYIGPGGTFVYKLLKTRTGVTATSLEDTGIAIPVTLPGVCKPPVGDSPLLFTVYGTMKEDKVWISETRLEDCPVLWFLASSPPVQYRTVSVVSYGVFIAAHLTIPSSRLCGKPSLFDFLRPSSDARLGHQYRYSTRVYKTGEREAILPYSSSLLQLTCWRVPMIRYPDPPPPMDTRTPYNIFRIREIPIPQVRLLPQ